MRVFAPKLYTTYKFKYRFLADGGFNLNLSSEEMA